MLQFVTVALRNMKTVGTVCPSSPALARALSKGLRAAKGPKRVLEVGPGTGPVTREILRSMHRGDEFDLVELSPVFSRDLERKILAPWRERHPGVRVTLHQGAVQDVPLQRDSYDFVICGLPFNNFDKALVELIMGRLMDLLKPAGQFSYFGYAGAKAVKSTVADRDGRANLRAIARFESDLRARHGGVRQIVLPNLPPAEVHRLTKR
ncbi:MAG: methyltransferase domain-containing protein [Phycisphaerales bacterium]